MKKRLTVKPSDCMKVCTGYLRQQVITNFNNGCKYEQLIQILTVITYINNIYKY